MCESFNCFWVKKNATVGFTGPAAKVMKFKIARVYETARMHPHTRTMHKHIVYYTTTKCAQSRRWGLRQQGTGGGSHWAQAHRYKIPLSRTGEISTALVHSCTHCRRSHWGDLGNHSPCERISDSKAEASQKTSRPGNLANKLFKREVSTSPNWQSDVTVMEMCQTEWWLMPEL